MRLACLLIQHFPLWIEALGDPSLRSGGPLVLYDARKLVLDCSSKALQVGVRIGIPLAQALSRHPALTAREADMLGYEEAFAEIAEKAKGVLVTTNVEFGPLGCLWGSVAGLEGLYGSEAGIAKALEDVVPAALPAQVGIADGKFAAWLAASAAPPGSPVVLSSNALPEFLAPHSVEVLPVSWEVIEWLKRFGLDTLGDLQRQAPGPLMAQFGATGLRIWQLANGQDDEPLIPHRPTPSIQKTRAYEPPLVTLESLWIQVEDLLGKAFLDGKNRSVRGTTLGLRFYPEALIERRVWFKTPLSEARSVLQRLRWACQELRLGGPVESISLTLWGLTQEAAIQGSLFAEVRSRRQLHDTAAALKARFGGQPQIFRFRDDKPWSRIPEDRAVLVEFDD